MIPKKKEHPIEKTTLHPRNKHRERYNFKQLIETNPELAPFVSINKYADESIDFFNPEAVKMLNKALLKHFYGLAYWDIPKHYLCPPIPGRADYIHHIADLLASTNKGEIPTGNSIKCLDIGVGANCVYPIIGCIEYGWKFIGSDIDPIAIESAKKIVDLNPTLKGDIELRLQTNPNNIFEGIIQKNERIEVTMCNPPFHTSQAEAQKGTMRKLSNLQEKKITKAELNFGGKNNELWCEGGEVAFIQKMIEQSKQFANSCLWFTSLVSKQAHLGTLYNALTNAGALEVKTIPMGTGNKSTRILAWTFLSKKY
jgi:23S rRNA (adenine1618-N6)-methyltransferase